MSGRVERLVSAAILRRGVVESRGLRSHAEIRRALGDENPYEHTQGDVEGFLTSGKHFVSRQQARLVGVASGQLSPMWRECHRDVLSSDIDWNAGQGPSPVEALPEGATRQQRRAAERASRKTHGAA